VCRVRHPAARLHLQTIIIIIIIITI